MKLSKPILFFHCVDNRNINAQSNNTKAILAGWDSKEFPAEALYFHDPDPAVAANPNVRLHRMPRNRLWKAYALKLIARKYSAVVYPGLSAVYDDRLRYLRKFIGNNDTVITTLEGLPGNAEEEDKENVRLSRMAGHRAYCQGINPTNMRAIDSMKSNADLVVAISPFLERMAAQMWPGRATAQVPLGVNLDCFNSKGRVPHGQNLRVRVVAAGSFQLRKRPELFLDLARAHPEADFTWYGDGPRRVTLQQQARNAGLGNLNLPGLVNAKALAQAFRQADVFTLPAVSEGVPKVTQEAAACGLPVVCMNYYEPFSVEHGVNGFQATDDNAYFSHIAALVGDAELRRRMGAAGAQMAQCWGWKNLGRRWQDTICSAARGRA
jgi:glycosyltransferase involved in cell wall biosynthesis